MANFTETEKVVLRKGSEIALEPGYGLVVIEDNQFSYYDEGRLPEKKGWLSFKKNKPIEVYAVSADDKHETAFKKPVAHADGIHTFVITISVRYGIGDPVLLIRKLRFDPVEKLREVTGQTIAGLLKTTAWEDLKDPRRFAQVRSRALEQFISVGRNDAVPVFDRVQEDAQSYGLKLIELNFEIKISEHDLKAEITQDLYEADKKVSDAEISRNLHVNDNKIKEQIQLKDHDNILRAMERKEAIADQMTKTAVTFIDTTGATLAEGTRTMDDIKKNLLGAMEIQNMFQTGASGSPALAGGTNPVNMIGPGQSLVHSLLDIVQQIKAENLDPASQRAFLGVLFQLTGAKLMNQDDETIARLVEPLSGIAVSADLQQYFSAKWQELKSRIENGNLL